MTTDHVPGAEAGAAVRFEASPGRRRREHLAPAAGTGMVVGLVPLLSASAAALPLAAALGTAAAALVFGVWEWRAARQAVRAVEVGGEGVLLELRRGRTPVPWEEVRVLRHLPGEDEHWVLVTRHARFLILAEGMSRDDREQLAAALAEHLTD